VTLAEFDQTMARIDAVLADDHQQVRRDLAAHARAEAVQEALGQQRLNAEFIDQDLDRRTTALGERAQTERKTRDRGRVAFLKRWLGW